MRIVRDLLLAVVGASLFVSSIFVILPYFGSSSEVTARGEATAKTCRFSWILTDSHAPDRENITGVWQVCDAEVRWADGRVETREVLHKPPVTGGVGDVRPVVERREKASNSSTRTVVHDADFDPRPIWGGAAMILTALIAFAIAGPAVIRLVERVRGRPIDVPGAATKDT